MSKIVIPEDQNLYPTPNEHVNFEFGDSIEEYRTSRYLNGILKMFGPDVILRGLDIRNISWSGDDLSIELNPGAIVQDSTLINVLYSFILPLSNLTTSTQNNSSYVVIIYTQFEYIPVTTIPTNNPHVLGVKIGILDTNSNILYNGDPATASVVSWDINKHRLILYSALITNINDQLVDINIDGNEYYGRGQRKNVDVFNYDYIPGFSTDGGLI